MASSVRVTVAEGFVMASTRRSMSTVPAVRTRGGIHRDSAHAGCLQQVVVVRVGVRDRVGVEVKHSACAEGHASWLSAGRCSVRRVLSCGLRCKLRCGVGVMS